MQIDVKTQGLELTDALGGHVRRRLDFALGWARPSIKGVTVSLSDENGPRGGKDKRCCIFVHLPSKPDVVISDMDASVLVAIDRAADRVGQAVSRRLERQRDVRRVSKGTSPWISSEAQAVE